MELITEAQQREAVVQGRSLSPYRLRYNNLLFKKEMKVTFTITTFIGFVLLFISSDFAQQPSPYQPPYQPTGEPPLQPRSPATPNTTQPTNGRTLQTPPMQNPPRSITTNGTLTYQPAPTYPTPPNQGFNSPFPTNLAPATPTPLTPTTSPAQSQPRTGLYSPNGNGNGNRVVVDGQGNVIRVADASGIPIANVDRTADTGVASTAHTGNLAHAGRSVPLVRVHPFILKPEEQRELDDFLLRWERYSETVKHYEVEFNSFFYDPTNPSSPQITSSEPQLKPLKIMFGSFKYVAPRKFVYYVEGEWVQKERVRYVDPEVTPNVAAEKTIIDGQSFFFYDFPAKKVVQYKMSPEVMNHTIANGPFPLIFGAKAADMKKRFSMKIVTNPDYREKEIWLWAVPLTTEDQREFAKIEIRLDKRTMNAMALKRIDSNEKSYTTYTLQNPRINGRFAKLDVFFHPDVPRGWKLEVQDQVQVNADNPIQPQNQNTTTHYTAPIPNNPQPRVEVPIYNP
ncbi:MAG: hypothetical protein LBJ00_15125 [Planctomycetaceae bacterium]|jgi:hypothetical protein|nr:hypothetical protein [Planctomycetaceae bacterium]